MRKWWTLAVLCAAALAGGATALIASGGAGVPAATAAAPATPAAAATQTRYSLVHGCYTLRSPVDGRVLSAAAGPFRMQATALGEYLLYSVHGDDLTDAETGTTTATPNATAVWRVDGSRARGFKIVNLGTGASVPVSFVPAAGCAVYPEAGVDATGSPFAGSSPTALVNGTIDAHTHITAFRFLGGQWHCGKPWDQFGAPSALPDCTPYRQGSNGEVETFVDGGTPGKSSDPVGWPTFKEWPSPTKLAEEGDYYTGIKRAWMAGLRVIVTQLVDNEALCMLMTQRSTPCNDMASVRIQANDLRALENYIDAQSGGPGKGFFRIVTNPFQARQVINSGKLAVVEGIEVSHILDCGEYLRVPQCSQAKIDSGLQELHRLGVSTFFPVHKFDNAFGGTKMDGGETGVLVNQGQHLETGHYWDIQTCTGAEHDNTQITEPTTGSLATVINTQLKPALGGGTIPLYPPPPHCNTQGLTDLGAYLINQMIKQHFIVELDHMDAKTADAALAIIEAHNYSGVISAHSWDSPQENVGIYKVGGFVTPIAGASPSTFIGEWKATQAIRDKRFYSGAGFGYGADMNGLAEESQPTSAHPIAYPFKSFDGRVTFTREQWGQRVFDLNKDGVANYGMFADWMQELQTLAGRTIAGDMYHGAEAYLEMWERTYGVPATTCRGRRGVLSANGTRALPLGATATALLYALGQPSSRAGASYGYCVAGAPGRTMATVLDRRGRSELWVTNAPGYAAGGVRPGARVSALGRHSVRVGSGLRRIGRFVYTVRGGRITSVAVATPALLRSAGALRSALRASGVT